MATGHRFQKGNKFSIGLSKTGRNPEHETPELMEAKVDEYFNQLFDEETGERIERPTITGLALYLGFDSRQSMYDYGAKPEFSYIIKRIRAFIEHNYENLLQEGKPIGAIFALKNMGWADRTEVDHTSMGKAVTQSQIVVYNSAPPLAGSENEVEKEKQNPESESHVG